jgi:hypothetical protein
MDDFLTGTQEEDVEGKIAWYWEKRGINEHPARLSRDTVAELLRYVS